MWDRFDFQKRRFVTLWPIAYLDLTEMEHVKNISKISTYYLGDSKISKLANYGWF